MSYQYIEAPSDEPAKNDESIFLAGGISNCPDWQKEVAEEFEKDLDRLTVYNPRRKNFEMFKGTAQFKESVIHYLCPSSINNNRMFILQEIY